MYSKNAAHQERKSLSNVEYLFSDCFVFAFSLSPLIFSVLIPPSLILAVALDHQCKPSFLCVPLDSAHLYRSSALLVLIRPEWVTALGSIPWSHRKHHRLTAKYVFVCRCVTMHTCAHVCVRSCIFVCVLLRVMLSVSLLSHITFAK